MSSSDRGADVAEAVAVVAATVAAVVGSVFCIADPDVVAAVDVVAEGFAPSVCVAVVGLVSDGALVGSVTF